MLLNNEVVPGVRGLLSASDFYHRDYARLFAEIVRLHDLGSPIDAVTVGQQLGDDLGEFLTPITRAMETVQNTRHAMSYAAKVFEMAKRRRIVEDCKRRIAAAHDVSKPIPGESVDEIKFHCGPELAALDTSVEWLVDDVLVAGQPCLNAAPKKTLKTNTLIDLTISVAMGVPFLGKFRVPTARRAGIMSAESGKATIKETANRIARAKGFQGIEDCTGALFAFETPMITCGEECQQFERFIADHELELLTVDPTYLTFLIGDGGKNIFHMGQLLAPLSRIIQRTNCTICLSHHSRKASGKDGEPLELGDESYSGFSEWARQWLYLSRREPYDETLPGSHKLWLRYGGSVGHAGLVGLDIEEGSHKDPGGRKWQVITVDAGGIRAERQDATTERRERQKDATFEKHLAKVRESLKTFPKGGTLSDVAGKARLSKAYTKEALYELEAQKEAQQTTIEKNKRPFEGWQPITGTVPLSHWDSPGEL